MEKTKQRITLFLDRELVRRLEMLAASRGTTMTDLLAQWIQNEDADHEG